MDNKEKTNSEEEALDVEGRKWLLIYPDMATWVERHSEMVEWMTEAVRFPPRSDCG